MAQPRRGERPLFRSGSKPIYVESHVVPHDSSNICYITYRVPYSNLVFIKDDIVYSAGIVFRVEVTGEAGVLARESTHDKIKVNTYEETKNPNSFLEGILSFEIKNEEATINPLVSLDNTDRQVPLRPFKLLTDDVKPIVAINSSGCSNSIGYKLVNYENDVPFDNNNYVLLIPIYGKKLDKIKVILSQDEKEIISKELDRSLFLQYGFQKCNENIYLTENLSNVTSSLFILDKFSHLLDEGPFEIEVKNSIDSVLYSGEMNSSWVNKPMSLMNPKAAYELLEVMTNEDALDKIYDEADGEYEDAIKLFWKKYDPDKNTKFNQLEYEFYARADKAIREYSATGDRAGKLSDRGKIYVKYGEPAEVERYYSDKNEITEVWKYVSPKTQFVFVDVTGLGKYKLSN